MQKPLGLAATADGGEEEAWGGAAGEAASVGAAGGLLGHLWVWPWARREGLVFPVCQGQGSGHPALARQGPHVLPTGF